MQKKYRFIILCLLGCMCSFTVLAAPLHIKQGMSYTKARKNLLRDGWQIVSMHKLPNGTPSCDHLQNDNQNCKYLEVDSCSGSGMGYCNMIFYDGEMKYLYVTTSGGPPQDASIDSWNLSKKSPNVVIEEINGDR